MAVYSVKLQERKVLADRTIGLLFERPALFKFKAGQFVEVIVQTLPRNDATGNRRAFSIASAPDEDHLLFATRLRDTVFKNALSTMPEGTAVTIEGPYGDFVLHRDGARPAVLLAGGIGITPFRSITRRVVRERLPHRLLVFYVNRQPKDAAFLAEFEELRSAYLDYTFVPTMTSADQNGHHWSGEVGRLTEEMIAKYVDRSTRPVYYIAGPPAMVAATRTTLEKMGVDEDDIRGEEFAGY